VSLNYPRIYQAPQEELGHINSTLSHMLHSCTELITQ